MDATADGLYVDKTKTRNSSMTAFNCGAASATQVAPASAKRKRITFSNQGTFAVLLFQQSTLDLNRFFPIGTAAGQYIFDATDYGTLIQQAWFAQGSGGASNLGVIDTVEE